MHSHPVTRAFTLLELLSAMAVTSLLLVMVSVVASQSLTQWEYVNGRVRSNYEARMILDWVARDLLSAVVENDTYEWLRISPQTVSTSLPAKVSKLMLYSQSGERPLDSQSGKKFSGPMGICYSLEYVDPVTLTGANKRYCLFRLHASPRETFEAMHVTNLESGFWDIASSSYGQLQPADVLVENCVSLRIVANIENLSNGTTLQSDPDQLFTAGPGKQVQIGTTVYSFARINSFTITVWMLTSKGATLMEKTKADTSRLLNQYSYPFSKEVTLKVCP